MADQAAITRLYTAALNRAPDAAGLAYWMNANDAGFTLEQTSIFFETSPEFVADYGALSDTAYVQQLYQNVLGRAGDTSGVDYWTGALSAGYDRGFVLQDFAESPENVIKTDALAAHTAVAAPNPPAIAAPAALVAAPAPAPVVTPVPVTAPDPAPVGPSNTVITTDTTLSQGTQTSPFVTADIIGQNAATLTVTGFIHADNVSGLGTLTLDRAGAVAGGLEVAGMLRSGQLLRLNNGTLILDNPGTALGNAIISGNGTLELHGLQFDASTFVPSPGNTGTSPGGQAAIGGSMELLNHGTVVYTIDACRGWSGGTQVGVDAVTGNDFIHFGQATS